MNIQQALAMIHQMQSEGIIGQYAIGGAVGATFYLEPMATLDVDFHQLSDFTGTDACLFTTNIRLSPGPRLHHAG